MKTRRRAGGRPIDWAEVHRRLARTTAADGALTPEQARAVLDERARALARVPERPPALGDILEVVCFTLANERYALETRYVREVVTRVVVARVPGAPDFLAGVINLRGEIVAIMDLRPLFHLPATASAEAGRVLVLGGERLEFGILADAVEEVTTLRADAILEPPGAVTGPSRPLLRGVTAEARVVLDGAALLGDPRLFIDGPG